MKKTAKEKKPLAPNECSILRWILVALIGLGLGSIIFLPILFSPFAKNTVDTFLGIPYQSLVSLLSFVPVFVCFVLALKFVAKTSMKDFILGVGGKVNKKESLIIFGLYVLGFVLAFILEPQYISLRELNVGHFAFLLLFMLMFTWIQTTSEELLYRGIFLRWACKNKIGYTKKAFIAALLSALLFAVSHATNPEVTSQSGWRVVLAVLSYAIPGLIYFWTNIHFGSLVPGIIIHFINNFLLFTMISEEVSAVSVPTLLIYSKPHSAESMFISVVLSHLPIVAYIIVDTIIKKKSAATAK